VKAYGHSHLNAILGDTVLVDDLFIFVANAVDVNMNSCEDNITCRIGTGVGATVSGF